MVNRAMVTPEEVAFMAQMSQDNLMDQEVPPVISDRRTPVPSRGKLPLDHSNGSPQDIDEAEVSMGYAGLPPRQDEVESKGKYYIGKTELNIPSHYKLSKAIGNGAYGVVLAAEDSRNNAEVAIKVVRGAFNDAIDAKRILREIKLMKYLDHPNILKLTDLLMPRSLSSFEDLYLVTPRMETDLHKVISSKQELTPDHVQLFMYQIIRALHYMHAAGVVHRDLKPQNLLVNRDCELMVCDFGLARHALETEGIQTEYVVTRWYRAPELLFSQKDYGAGVDMWAVGCIMAELFVRQPILPGANYLDQIRMICKTFGRPHPHEYAFLKSKRAHDYLKVKHDYPKRKFCDIFQGVPQDALDLMEGLLQFNPQNRISATQALSHPYFKSLTVDEDFFVEDTPFEFRQENVELDRPRLQELIFCEIASYHNSAKEILEEASRKNRLYFPLEISKAQYESTIDL